MFSDVFLTWARQRVLIFLWQGAMRDRTRNPDFYEGMYDYLTGMGLTQV